MVRRFLPAFAILTVARLAAAAETVQVHADLEFLGAGRTERLDLYLPPVSAAAASARRPALVWIHGGGFTGGTKSETRAKEICTILAEVGYVAVSIDYKLGEGAWPQNLLDCKNAVRWLRAHADRYHLDPQRIAVAGGSAGGHLALMVALTAGQAALEPAAPYPHATSDVRCAINMYGITNLLTRQKTDAKGNPTGERNAGASLRVFGATDTHDPVLRLASPVTHVTRTSPPILILHGKADTTVDYRQAEELAAALAKAGASHEMVLLENVGHTFAFRTWGKKKLSRDLTPEVLRFLARHNR
jgi:acetyl esterase/lipase